MNNLNENYCYYAPGQLVRVRHNVEFRPKMWITEKCSRNIKNPTSGAIEPSFIGMKCRWFNADGDLQEGIFSTKDLELVDE